MSQPSELKQEQEPPVVIHLLAGGQSRRMGLNKVDLMLGCLPLAQWAQCSAASLEVGEVNMIRKDRRPGMGPLAGMETGMLSRPAKTHLFLSCDMPFVSSRTMLELLETSAKHQRIACMHHLGYSGFPMALPHQRLDGIGDMLDAGEFRLRRLLDEPTTLRFDWMEEDAKEACNINTPEAFAEARDWVHQEGVMAPIRERQKPLICLRVMGT